MKYELLLVNRLLFCSNNYNDEIIGKRSQRPLVCFLLVCHVATCIHGNLYIPSSDKAAKMSSWCRKSFPRKNFVRLNFCLPKIWSDKEYGWVNSLTITLSILWLEMEKFRFNSMKIFELLIMRSLCMNKNITGAMHGVGFFEIIMMKTIHYFIHVPTWSVFQWIWSFSHHLLFNTIFESLKFAE